MIGGGGAVAPLKKTLIRFALPHDSAGLPVQASLQSVNVACVAPFSMRLSQSVHVHQWRPRRVVTLLTAFLSEF